MVVRSVASQWVLQMGALVAILLCGVPIYGCAQMDGSIQSQVIDAQTNQPIPGAVVLGVWTKRVGFPGLDHTELVGNHETETDAEGRFTLERPAGNTTAEEWVTIYKFGYVAWSNIYIFQEPRGRPDPAVPPQILLDSFPPGASHDEHIRFIYRAISSTVSRDGDRHHSDKAIERENEAMRRAK